MLNFEDVEERDGKHCYLARKRIDKRYDFTRRCPAFMECLAVVAHRGNEDGRPHIRSLHASEVTRGFTASTLRAGRLQTALPRHPQSLLVWRLRFSYRVIL
jgi:hypothetical protein